MRYPGGKGLTFRNIINIIPEHEVYIETHLGGGAVLRNKRPARRNIGVDIDPQVVSVWKQRYSHCCELFEADAISFLKNFKFVGNEVVYADPPYLSNTRSRSKIYRFEYCEEDHHQLLQVLQSLPCNVLISGYPSDLYHQTIGHWNRLTFSAKTHASVREENVWFNFELPSRLHDSRYLGRTFRAREVIRRRHATLQRRFAGFPAEEKHAFVCWIKSNYPELIDPEVPK